MDIIQQCLLVVTAILFLVAGLFGVIVLLDKCRLLYIARLKRKLLVIETEMFLRDHAESKRSSENE